MALGAQREVYGMHLNFVAERAGEAGGIMSRVASSGYEVIGYLEDVACAQPLGIQLHNVEHMDLGYQYHPWLDRGVRRVSQPGEVVAICPHGVFDTNFIHPDASPHSGAKAYLAPSGLITNDPSFGGPLIGKFESDLNDMNVAGLPIRSEYITVYGGGYVRTNYMKKVDRGKYEIQQPQVERVTLFSPGYARVRIQL